MPNKIEKENPLERTNFENHELWTWVMNQFEFAKRHRDPQMSVFRRAEDYLYGNHWKNSRMPDYKSKIVINDVFEAIETMLPVVTARAPKIEVVPRPKTFDQKTIDYAKDFAEGLEREFDDIWDTTKMPRKNREAFRNMKGYGNGILKSVKVEGEDQIENEVVDIYTVFPDPFKSSIRDCENSFFIHAPVMYVSEIKRIYNVDVPAEGELDEFRSFQFAQQVEQNPEDGQLLSPVSDTEYERVEQYETRPAGVGPTIEGQALVIECWYYHDDEEKYPNGRVTTIARNVKDKILYDGPRKYKYIPFFGMKNYSESRSFWGRPEAEQIKTLNRSTNMIISQVVDNIRLTANPKHERLRGANISKKQITSEPGTGILSSILNGFRWIDPPKMPRYIFEVLNFLGLKTDNVTGVQDAWRGRTSGPTESGRHAEVLRSQTAGRLQPPVEEMVDMIKELGEHWNYIIQHMYKEDKVHAIQDSEGNYQYKPFSGMIMNPGDDIGEAIDSRSMDFEVKLSIGTLLPHDKGAELEETMAVIQMASQGVPPNLVDPLIDASQNIRDKARLKKLIRENPVPTEPGQNGQQLTPEEIEILQSDDEDAIALLLAKKPELRALIDQGGGQQ